MKPAMYLFINRGLDMSPGKIAAQAGHAAAEAALLSHPYIPQHDLMPYGESSGDEWRPTKQIVDLENLWNAWRRGLHYAKYVMEARDNEHIRDIDFYLRERGFRTKLIIDEGHTEIDPIQPTALGVALVDKDDEHTAATFSSFRLYRDKRPSELMPRPEFKPGGSRLLTNPTDDLERLKKNIKRHGGIVGWWKYTHRDRRDDYL